jgi:2-polyprenyl-3-methyl-5-hydroxy-6-metoxy-1,4-benzoquinol methylase
MPCAPSACAATSSVTETVTRIDECTRAICATARNEATVLPMTCAQCAGIESEFGEFIAKRELKHFRRRGPRKTTRRLLDAVHSLGISGATLLDVGGGVGAIHHELLDAGAARAEHVDASTAYLRAAHEEAERRGHAARVTFRHGDFLDLAPTIPAADVVTLDRVVCCYPNAPDLLEASAAHARRIVALVYPRDTRFTRMGTRMVNLFMRLKRSSFRTFTHPTALVEGTLERAGLTRRYRRVGWWWQITVFSREA